MFHLFNKTYITIDEFIDINNDRIVISEANGFPIAQILDNMSVGTLYSYGQTVSEIVGSEKQYPTMLDMFKFCLEYNKSTNKKIVIYCDQAAYLEIISQWYKTIFVEIDSDSAYRISKAYFAKEIMVTHRSIKGMGEAYETFLPDSLTFKNVFDQVTVEPIKSKQFLDSLENSKSIEYLLASYIFNGSYKDELKSRVWQMINRHVEEYLKEAWRSIQLNIMRKSWQEMLNTADYTIENILEVANDPQLQALKNTNAWRAMSGGMNIAREPLNLTTYTEAQINQIKQQVRQTYLNSPDASKDHPAIVRKNYYLDLVRYPSLTDQQLEDVLDYEMDPPDDEHFWSLKDEETINIYLADYILEARKYNRKYQLAPYLLR